MRVVIAFACLALSVAAAGCAFQPHKPVVINPELAVKPKAIGQNKALLVNVVDERPRSTLGTRGVRGVGAEIGVDGDIRVPIRRAVSDGLKQHGFSPAAAQVSDGRELRIEIRNLDYGITQGFWAGTLRTECGLKAVCIVGNARPYEQLYRGEFQTSLQVVQPEDANERYINSAVTDAVNAMLNDDALMQCLAR